jgi:superfamily II helicase
VEVEDLQRFGAPAELVAVWQQQITSLTDIQEKAVRAGVLNTGKNLLAVAPTSLDSSVTRW